MKKLPKRDPNLPAEQQGMFHKYDVRRVYSDREVPGKHIGCQYFVLDETHDPFARPALQAYAMACQATHPQLAEELFAQWGVPASLDKPAPIPIPAFAQTDPSAPSPSAMGVDATKWTAAFIQLNRASDWGTMNGWFANAIMAGFDEGQRRAVAARSVPDTETDATGLLQSLWTDMSLRQLMRPDQVRRLEQFFAKLSSSPCQACKGGGIQADGPCECQQKEQAQ